MTSYIVAMHNGQHYDVYTGCHASSYDVQSVGHTILLTAVSAGIYYEAGPSHAHALSRGVILQVIKQT